VIKKTEKDDGNYVEAKVSVKDEKGDVKVEGKGQPEILEDQPSLTESQVPPLQSAGGTFFILWAGP
jgi:hypothetical protein